LTGRSGRGGRPEVWAGVECTVNRVRERFHDQLARNGHLHRPDDLERFAALGVTAIRYPVLWEHVAPVRPDRLDWSIPDARLPRLRALGVRPIVGLVHHGSGPRWTSLVDPAFPDALARYARAAAERFPWVTDWTPVNEPLTTARFSGLYGHWYPHGKDERVFVRALITELRGTVLAMREIRAVNPRARLVQTEDMGRTTSTPRLGHEAEFQNLRRWLGFDLLCGRVDAHHPWHARLLASGATEAELAFHREHATPPDVIGLNYYVTSDRFVDERLELYPAWSHGGSSEPFADVHSAIADPAGISGHAWALRAAWERYRLPVALTEVHLGGPREEQLRWLAEAWAASCALRGEGVDVRALTVWSLLGAFDWHRLVTVEQGFYEPGPFDVRSARPRPTALAAMTRSLATTGTFEHPVLEGPGFWRRPDRITCGPAALAPPRGGPHRGRPVVIVGSTGTLGRAFARVCRARGLAHVLVGRAELDLAAPASAAAALDRHEPWAVVNAAGYVRVDDAEREVDRCLRENAEGPAVLARACAARRVALVTFSSDLVFDGRLGRAYVEDDPVSPLGVYGRSKAEAERRVLEALPSALVVRTSAFFGPWDRHNFVTLALEALRRDEPFAAADDLVVSPTYVPDLVHATLDLLVDGETGRWHLANAGETSWAALAREAARRAGLDEALVRPVPASSLPYAAARPRASVLASARGAILPPLEDALGRYLHDRAAAMPAGGGRVACAACGEDHLDAAGCPTFRTEPVA
jgi:dTDP-4-dehydrorhamnose reductase